MDIIKIIEEAEDFPSLPNITFQLNQLMSNPQVSLKSIASLIETDTAIVTKILKTVNSGYYMLKSPISDIHHAVSILGMQAMNSIVMAASFENLFPAKKLPVYGHLFRRSICACVASDLLADISGIKNRSESFVASLLQNLGSYVFMYFLNEEYIKILEEARGNGLNLANAEKSYLKVTNAQAAVIIAEKWKLPDAVTLAIRYQNNIKLANKKILKNEVIQVVEHSYLSGIVADIFTGWNKSVKIAQFRREYIRIFSKYENEYRYNYILGLVPKFVNHMIKSMNKNVSPVPSLEETFKEADFELEMFMNRYNSMYNSFKKVEEVFK